MSGIKGIPVSKRHETMFIKATWKFPHYKPRRRNRMTDTSSDPIAAAVATIEGDITALQGIITNLASNLSSEIQAFQQTTGVTPADTAGLTTIHTQLLSLQGALSDPTFGQPPAGSTDGGTTPAPTTTTAPVAGDTGSGQ